MTLKPCIVCEKDCDIFPIQLGDIFTLTYLRICCAECLWHLTYTFMRNKWMHTEYRLFLWNYQNKEDEEIRNKEIDEMTQRTLEQIKKDINPNLLSLPVPQGMLNQLSVVPGIESSGICVKLTRPSLADRIQWQQEHVKELKLRLAEEEMNLEKLEMELP